MKDAEILVLRHWLAVLRRQVRRPRFGWFDRALIALFAGLVDRERWSSFLVSPRPSSTGTVASSGDAGPTHTSRPGRPALPAETVELIRRRAKENPRWGYLRIVGELRKLGVTVPKTSVANTLRRHCLPPAPRRQGPTWSEFLSAQAKGVLATDFFLDHLLVGSRRHLESGARRVRRSPQLGALTEDFSSPSPSLVVRPTPA